MRRPEWPRFFRPQVSPVTFDACFITILPKFDNDGIPLTDEARAVLDAIVLRFGAYSTESVQGEWVGPDGTRYGDDSARVTVFCAAADRAEARALVADAGRTLRQEAMFFEWRHPVDAEVIDTPNPHPEPDP